MAANHFNDGTNSIFKALRDNTDGAQNMFLSEFIRVMEKYPWCDGINIGLDKGPFSSGFFYLLEKMEIYN